MSMLQKRSRRRDFLLSLGTAALFFATVVSLLRYQTAGEGTIHSHEKTVCPQAAPILATPSTVTTTTTSPITPFDETAFRIGQYEDAAVWKPWEKPKKAEKQPLPYTKADKSQGYSSITVLSPGLCHISNVYHHNDTLIFIVKDPGNVVSTGGYRVNPAHCLGWAKYEVVTPKAFAAQHAKIEERWTGTSLMTFDSSSEISSKSWIFHYYHFIELIAPLWTLKSSTDKLGLTSGQVNRAIYLDRPIEQVQGGALVEGDPMNIQVLGALFGLDRESIFASDDIAKIWNDYGDPAMIMIEDALVVSRGAVHSYSGIADVFGKIGMSILSLVTPDSIRSMKETIMQNLKITPKLNGPPRVTYVDRQDSTNRRLTDSAHAQLTAKLAELKAEGWDVQTPKMEHLSFAQQVEVMTKTDVLLGVHGNGLTNLLYMPMAGGLIEIFPEDHKAWDYEWLSAMSGIKYLGVDANGVIWDKRAPTLVNSDKITVDPNLITRIVRTWRKKADDPASYGFGYAPTNVAGGSWMKFEGIGTWIQH